MNYRAHFSRFLGARPGRLHFAAHSHHPWPDASLQAQQRCWLDAATYMDRKWDLVFGEVIPGAQAHVARLLRLPDPASVVFAPNVHSLLLRLLSCIERRPVRILTTDSEFYSFERQIRRLEEAQAASVTRVAVEPFADFETRFVRACANGGHDLVWFSQCFFNSGYRIGNLAAPVAAVPDARTLVAIDGYHGFMAVPTDLGAIAGRAFYLAGGYKYAMSGEGVCFMHCPAGYAPRPLDTGWFAGAVAPEAGEPARLGYPQDGGRFWGSTFDPVGLYRFNAVMDWCRSLNLDPAAIHAHVEHLQQVFLCGRNAATRALAQAELVPAAGLARGNFLCLRLRDAAHWCARLAEREVMVDARGDRLRFGFGIYHDEADVAALVARLD